MELIKQPVKQIKMKNNRSIKRESKKDSHAFYIDHIKEEENDGVHEIIMKKVWRQNYYPNNNDLLQSKMLKNYYEELSHQAIKVQKNKGRFNQKEEASKNKRISLKSNPYGVAFTKIEQILRKHLMADLFDFNLRKNWRMSQSQINTWKMIKNEEKSSVKVAKKVTDTSRTLRTAKVVPNDLDW